MCPTYGVPSRATYNEWFYQSISAGNTILEDMLRRPILVVCSLSGMAVGITAFIAGITAIVKHEERALFSYISILLGAFVILLILGEIFSAH